MYPWWTLVIMFYVGMAVAWLITGLFRMNKEERIAEPVRGVCRVCGCMDDASSQAMSATKEQIEEAKIDIAAVTRLNLGVIPLQDGQILLDALSTAERERDEAVAELAKHKRKEWDALTEVLNVTQS